MGAQMDKQQDGVGMARPSATGSPVAQRVADASASGMTEQSVTNGIKLILGIVLLLFSLWKFLLWFGIVSPEGPAFIYPKPAATSYGPPVESNGLTRETNDFLRDLGKNPANRR